MIWPKLGENISVDGGGVKEHSHMLLGDLQALNKRFSPLDPITTLGPNLRKQLELCTKGYEQKYAPRH